jgi:hypothetical protein
MFIKHRTPNSCFSVYDGMHYMSVSLAQNGKGLGAMWGKEMACEMLGKAGFREICVEHLPHDPINDYYMIRGSYECILSTCSQGSVFQGRSKQIFLKLQESHFHSSSVLGKSVIIASFLIGSLR